MDYFRSAERWVVRFIFACIALVAVAGATRGAIEASSPTISQEQQAAASTVLVEVKNGHGTGVVIADGLVLTNNHVIDKSEKDINVVRADGQKHKAAVLWKGQGGHDLALLSVNTGNAKSAAIDCAAQAPGTQVFTHGNPMSLRNITTWGRVSGKADNADDEIVSATVLDLTLTSGNSGGGIWTKTSWGDPHLVGLATAVVIKPIGFGATQTGLSVMIPSTVICRLLGRS
jgi:S1-C subfamily serine protease